MPRHAAAPRREVLDVDGILVEVVRKRVKNLNLRVRRDGSVTVSARPGIDVSRIAHFVSSRRDWIVRAQARLGKKRAILNARCTEGAEIWLWGQALTCHIVADEAETKRMRCVFSPSDGRLEVSCSSSFAGADEDSIALRSKRLDAWLSRLIKKEAANMLGPCEEIVGRRCSALRFRHMTSRWGSCNTKTAVITLNIDLVHYPPACLRYVLIHELCHLIEPNHGEGFHLLMDLFCPDWRTLRATLEER